jgi:hypothetical protein
MALVPLSEDCRIRCLGYELDRKGLVNVYVLEVVFDRPRPPIVLKMTPAQISSQLAFKRALINRCIPFPLPWNKSVYASIRRMLFEVPLVELDLKP